ncbi:hypothetical protein Tco_0571486 [Tanacetum coccineum]
MLDNAPADPDVSNSDADNLDKKGGSKSSRCARVPLRRPYEAIRRAYLVGTDTESEPFEDLGTESPVSPHVVASPILFPDSTPPVGHVEGFEGSGTSSAGTRHRIPPHLFQPDINAYRDTPFWLNLTGSEDAEDEGPAAGDDDPSLDDEDYGLNDKIHGMDNEGHSVMGALSAGELAIEEDQRYSTFEVDPKDGTVYIDVPTYPPSAPHVQTPPLPDWTLGSLPISLSHSDAPSPVSSPLISLTIPSPVATPTATIPVNEDQFIEVGAQLVLYGSILQDHTQRLDAMPPTLLAEIDRDVRELYTRSGAVRDEIFSQRYWLRSLEQEQERAVMTFGALWRPVQALEIWTGHVDTWMANMSRAGYDDHRLVHDLLVQQTSLQHELQEMRGRITALEQERDRGEQ